MAKRFTDTEKWKDEWYLSLDNDNRIVWQYLLDSCSIAGLLKKNFKLLNFCCNVNYNEFILLDIFKDRVFDIGDYFFIPKFLKFQYPKGLKSDKPAIVSVRNELLDKGLIDNDYEIIFKSFKNHSETIKDKYKDKVKDMDMDKDQDKGNFGKSENLLLIPVMLETFKKANPSYGASPDKDYRPLFSIASYFCEVGKLSGSPDLHSEKILEAWGAACTVIMADNFYKQKSLSTISNHIQEILQIAKNGKSNPKTNGKIDRDLLNRKLNERYPE